MACCLFSAKPLLEYPNQTLPSVLPRVVNQFVDKYRVGCTMLTLKLDIFSSFYGKKLPIRFCWSDEVFQNGRHDPAKSATHRVLNGVIAQFGHGDLSINVSYRKEITSKFTIPQSTSPTSLHTPAPYPTNAQFCNRNVRICAHFCYKTVHCGIFVWCIVGFVRWVCSFGGQGHLIW